MIMFVIGAGMLALSTCGIMTLHESAKKERMEAMCAPSREELPLPIRNRLSNTIFIFDEVSHD